MMPFTKRSPISIKNNGSLHKSKSKNIPVTSAEADVANWRWYVEAINVHLSTPHANITMETLFIGVLKEEEEKKKKKEKDNQYKLKKAMATPLA